MNNINVYAFADEASASVDLQIEAMRRNGLNGVELRNIDGKNISEISLGKAKEVKKKLQDNGLIAWSIGSPIGKIHIENDDFNLHTEKFKHTLEVANTLDAKNIRIFSFFIPSDKNPDDYKNEVINRLGTLLDLAKNTGINLCHENEKGIYGDVALRCLEIHKALSDMKGIFDPANFVQCGEDTKKAWELLKDYIYYIHIKDALYDGSIVPSGFGDGNMSYIAGEFLKKGGKNFTIEPHLAVFQGLSDLEKDGNTSEIGKKYTYKTNDEAFDAACDAFYNIIGG